MEPTKTRPVDMPEKRNAETGMLKKQKSHAFGKDCYLLGRDQYGCPIWLEAAQWDCGWYWGFGYVETYTREWSPSASRDINSHQHFDGFVWFKDENHKYYHHLNESPRIMETVLTDSESWQLTDLMKSYYTLEAAAALYKQGNSHLTSSGKLDELVNDDARKRINEVELPAIFKAVYALLSPSAEEA